MEVVSSMGWVRRWRAFTVALVALCLFCLLNAQWVAVADEIGGFITESLMGRSGVADSLVLVGRSGVGNSQIDVGMGAIVSTSPATNIMSTGATLNGTLTDLNGMPYAVVHFEWGYDTGYGSTSSSQTLTGTGDFSINIGDYDANRVVYFRAVAETDGTMYGSNRTFQRGTFPDARDLLWLALPVIIFCGMCLAAIRYGSPAILVGGILAGLLAWVIIQAFLNIPL